jgi:hypothetical protein
METARTTIVVGRIGLILQPTMDCQLSEWCWHTNPESATGWNSKPWELPLRPRAHWDW